MGKQLEGTGTSSTRIQGVSSAPVEAVGLGVQGTLPNAGAPPRGERGVQVPAARSVLGQGLIRAVTFVRQELD